jgi:hypothetical protein
VAYTDNPYVKVEIQRRDPSNIYRSPCIDWERSSTSIYQQRYRGADIVGLHPGRSLTSATLTKDITIDKAGKYWMLIRVVRARGTNPTITLSIDGETVKTISSYYKWEHYRFLDFGYVDLTAGTHTFVITLNGRKTWVDHLLMYRLEYFSSDEKDSSYRLDWKDIEFTENNLGDLNSAEITLPIKEIWNDPNENIYSRTHFEFMDLLNIIVGASDDWSQTKPKFGGYVLGYDENDEGTEMTLAGVGSLVNLYRKPVYTNYWVGVAPTSDETYTFPVRKFGSFLESIRHASDTSEYGPMNYGIFYPYTLNLDFRIYEDYEKVTVSGFNKTYSPSTGLRLGYDKLTPDHCGVTPDMDCDAVLFNDPYNPVDASVDDILSLKYLAAGESCQKNNRVQFNLKLTMHKANQTVADAQTYNILFTGKAGATNIIGQETPVLNGLPQLMKFDWKEAFEDYVASSNYYVSKIEAVDVAIADQITSREKSTIHLIGLTAYDSDLNTKMKINQETGYAYENIKEMLDNAGYIAYMDYGRERCHDVLCIAPEMNEVSTVQAIQGINVLDVTDRSYKPRDSIHNRILVDYHYKKGDTEKTGRVFYENEDSGNRFGPGFWEAYEDQTDISSKTDALLYGKKYVEENSYPLKSFTIVMKGTPLLNPSQYMVSKLPKYYLSGNYSTKTATHNINDEGYITRVGVNRPGKYYTFVMRKLQKNLKKYLKGQSQTMYNTNVLTNMGLTSLGAFMRGGST